MILLGHGTKRGGCAQLGRPQDGRGCLESASICSHAAPRTSTQPSHPSGKPPQVGEDLPPLVPRIAALEPGDAGDSVGLKMAAGLCCVGPAAARRKHDRPAGLRNFCWGQCRGCPGTVRESLEAHQACSCVGWQRIESGSAELLSNTSCMVYIRTCPPTRDYLGFPVVDSREAFQHPISG